MGVSRDRYCLLLRAPVEDWMARGSIILLRCIDIHVEVS